MALAIGDAITVDGKIKKKNLESNSNSLMNQTQKSQNKSKKKGRKLWVW